MTTTPKKDVVWNISNTEFKVLNVPFSIFNNEEYYDLDVTFKLSMIKDLMFQNEIPPTVDFEDVADFDINF